jgi:cell division septation protein DedD
MSPAERLPPVFAAQSNPQEPAVPRIEEPEADAEPTFATLPDITERDLQADTLAFERIGRRSPRSGGWLKLVVVLAVIGGAGAGAWRMWGEDLMRSAGDEIPTVRAADGPFKVRPEVPGGADIQNRDKQVYELLERGKAPPERPETLRPSPEAPLPPPVAAQSIAPGAATAAGEEGSPQMVEGPGSEEDDDDMVMTPVDPPSDPANPPPVPRLDAGDSLAKGSPSPERVQTAQRPAPPPAPPAVKSESANLAIGETPPRAFRIQLGAVRSEAAARTEWARLQKQHQAVLARLGLNVERADLGTKGVYFRIQAGPFADRAAADAACLELTKQKVPCLPIRPES